MNDAPRQKLRDIIRQHGQKVIENPRRVENLLRDYCGEYRREISVLTMALEEHAAADMLSASALPRKVTLLRLAQRLCDNLALSESAARWSIESWAWALGLISDAEIAGNENELAAGRSEIKQAKNVSPQTAAQTTPAKRTTQTQAANVTALNTVYIVSANGGGNYTSISEALRNIPANSRLLIREGLYQESIVLDKNVEIEGDGAFENIIVRSTDQSCISMRSERAAVSGLTLQGRGKSFGKAFFAVDIPRGTLTLENCDITSDTLSCVAIYGAKASPILKSCRIHDGADSGIYLFDNARALIENCEVYKARLAGEDVAVKWFFPAMATAEQRASMELLIRKGAPSEHFLYPMEITTAANVPGFGYIMPLRPKRFKNIVDLMTRRIEPTFRALATAGFNLAHNYLLLHSQGLCYRDISFGNAFFDPDNGDVLIADNDNVSVDGAGVLGVLGTPRFMAPEIVRGEAVPSTQTDLFSLSVLIFYMLMVAHPLEGAKEAAIKAMDLPAMNKIYGKEPIFIFDPNDASNRPVPGIHDNALAFWRIYPQFLHDIFIRAFTIGIKDPKNGRVRESEWRGEMIKLRDAIFYCPHCSLENFYDSVAVKASGGNAGLCWACAAQLQLPPRIRIGKFVVMLNHDTRLFPHHIDDARLYDFSAPVAAVAVHPTQPNVWGLKNLSQNSWAITAADGSLKMFRRGAA